MFLYEARMKGRFIDHNESIVKLGAAPTSEASLRQINRSAALIINRFKSDYFATDHRSIGFDISSTEIINFIDTISVR